MNNWTNGQLDMVLLLILIIVYHRVDHRRLGAASGETTKPLSKVRGENTQD